MTYVVCNKPLNIETNRFCEFDGDVEELGDGSWRCPRCGYFRWISVAARIRESSRTSKESAPDLTRSGDVESGLA